jgi:hypothetical protein
MTRVAILPIQTENGTAYRAVAGDKQSQGHTAGAALDALTAQLPPTENATLVIIHSQRPDPFFTAAQQQRLAELMAAWRSARQSGTPWSAQEQAELEALVEAELRASAARTAALADEMNR